MEEAKIHSLAASSAAAQTVPLLNELTSVQQQQELKNLCAWKSCLALLQVWFCICNMFVCFSL